MNCHGVKAVWEDYWDGRLLPGLEDKISRHLKNCSRCAAEVRAHQQWLRICGRPQKAPENIHIPKTEWTKPKLSFMNRWSWSEGNGLAGAYALAFIYLLATPVLKHLGMRFF